MSEQKTLYVCDPMKGQECSSSAVCIKNGGHCYITTHKHFAATPISVVEIDSAYDKLVTRLLHERSCKVNKETKNPLAELGILGIV